MKKYVLSFAIWCSVLSLSAPDEITETQQDESNRESDRPNPFDELALEGADKLPLSPEVLERLNRQVQLNSSGEIGRNQGLIPGLEEGNIVASEPSTIPATKGNDDDVWGDLASIDSTVVEPTVAVRIKAPASPIKEMQARLRVLVEVLRPDGIQRNQIRVCNDALRNIGKFPENVRQSLRDVLEKLLLIVQGKDVAASIPDLRAGLDVLVKGVGGEARDEFLLFIDAAKKFIERKEMQARLRKLVEALKSNLDLIEVCNDALRNIDKFPENVRQSLRDVLEKLLLIAQGKDVATNIPDLLSALNVLKALPKEGEVRDDFLLFVDAAKKFSKRNNQKIKGIIIREQTLLYEGDYITGDQFRRWLINSSYKDFATATNFDQVLNEVRIPQVPDNIQERPADNFLLYMKEFEKTFYLLDKSKTEVNQQEIEILKEFAQEQEEKLQEGFLNKIRSQDIKSLSGSEKGRAELALQERVLKSMIRLSKGLLRDDFELILVGRLGYSLEEGGILGRWPQVTELLDMLTTSNAIIQSEIEDIIEKATKSKPLSKFILRLVQDFQGKKSDKLLYMAQLEEACKDIMKFTDPSNNYYNKMFSDFFNKNGEHLSLQDVQEAITTTKRFLGGQLSLDSDDPQQAFESSVKKSVNAMCISSYENPLVEKFGQEAIVAYLKELAVKNPKRSKFVNQMIADFESVAVLKNEIAEMKAKPSAFTVNDALELISQMNKRLNTVSLRGWYLGDRKTYNNLQQQFAEGLHTFFLNTVTELNELPFNLLVAAKKNNYGWGVPGFKNWAQGVAEYLTLGDTYKAFFKGFYTLDRGTLHSEDALFAKYSKSLEDISQQLRAINQGTLPADDVSKEQIEARLAVLEGGNQLLQGTKNQIIGLHALALVRRLKLSFSLKPGLYGTKLNAFIDNMEADPSYIPKSSSGSVPGKDDELEWIQLPVERSVFQNLCASPETREIALAIARSAKAGKVVLPIEASIRADEIFDNPEIEKAIAQFHSQFKSDLYQREIEELETKLTSMP